MESTNDIILTGIPRSGTTLACFLLSQIPDFVALNEPMPTMTYNSYETALEAVPGFYEKMRRSILMEGTAIARSVNGKMTDNHFTNKKGARKSVVQKQEVRIQKQLNKDFQLALKHNALFTILLSDLVQDYPLFAFIRNPISVLGSWNSLEMPASKGEIRAARKLLPKLNTKLAGMNDIYDRQLYLLNWYFERYLSLAPEKVIKYESLISSGGKALQCIDKKALDLEQNLVSKNKNKVYDQEVIRRLGERLLNEDHACWEYYEKAEVETLL